MFTIYGGVERFTQWDIGHKVANEEMAVGDKVTFRNASGKTFIMYAYNEGGTVVVNVPNQLLQKDLPILVDLNDHPSQYITFDVDSADQPEDYVFVESNPCIPVPQANLDQNDPTAPDYVKGRLCYREKIAEVDLPGGRWFEHETPLVVGEKYSVFITGSPNNPDGDLVTAEAVKFDDKTIGFDAEIPAFGEYEPYKIRVRTDSMRIDFANHVVINRLKQLPNDLIPDNIARLDNLQIHMVDKSNFIFADVLLAYEAGKVILCDDGWEILTLCGGVPLSTNVAARYFDFSNIDPASGTVNCIRIKGDNTYQRTTYKIALTQT